MSIASDERDYDADMLEGHLDSNCFHVDGEPIDDKELVRRIQAGDETAFSLLLSNNEKFLNGCAADLADRYGVYHLSADLKQEGAIAMLNAAKQFDFSRGVKFLTYAYPIVKFAVLDYAAETTMPVRLPPTEYHRVRKTAWVLAVAPPGTAELELLASVMEQLGVSRKVAAELMSRARSIFDGVQLGDRADYLSYGSNPATHYTAKLRQEHIDELLATLTPRERTLIRKYCGFDDPDGEGMTFEELAVRLNFNSPGAAEKAFKKAVARLKDVYGKIGNYGSWREAERAVLHARRNSAEPVIYSTPQVTWYEGEWEQETDSPTQPTAETQSGRTP